MSALWIASVQAALLAAIVAAVLATLDRRAPDAVPPALRHALWWVVVLRFATPIAIPDPIGVPRPGWWMQASAPAWPAETAAPAPETAGPTGRFDWPTSGRTDPRRPPPADPPPRADRSSRAAREPRPTVAPVVVPSAPSRAQPGAAASPVALEAAGTAGVWLTVWVVGAALFAARAIGAEFSFRGRILATATPAGPRARAALARAVANHRTRRPVEVLETDRLDVPAAHGLRRWRILLPTGLDRQLDEAGLDFVVGHELAHLRHRDPAMNLVLTAIHAAHWFNPFAWLAVRGVRAEREALRDADALAADQTLAPDRCARALLSIAGGRGGFHPSLAGLTPGRRASLRRRLEMIVRERPFPRTATLLGGLGCAAFGWAGLLGVDPDSGSQPAAVPSIRSVDTPAHVQQGGIRVIREVEEPAWEAHVRERLATPVSWSEHLAPSAALDRITEQSGLAMTLAPELAESWDADLRIPPLAGALPLTDTLDLIAWFVSQSEEPVEWQIVRDGIEFFASDDGRVELRFYQVQPLLAAGYEFDALVETATDADPHWDHRDAQGVELWSDQILLRTTPRSHARIHAELERLLAGPTASPSPIEEALARGLSTPVEPDRTIPVAELPELAAQHGVTVWIAPSSAEDLEPVRSRAQGEPLGALLRRFAGAQLTVTSGAVLIGDPLPLTTWIVDVDALVEPTAIELQDVPADGDAAAAELADMRADKRERLQDLILEYADPRSWEEVDGSQIRALGDKLLLLRNTRPALQHAERFLAAARRARAN